MRRALRRLRGRYPAHARHVAIKPKKPWYARILVATLLVIGGYALAYWQIRYAPTTFPDRLSREHDTLLSQVVLVERQLQIERATQKGVAKEMAALQDEVMHLKEDVQFYKSILAESGGSGVIRFHSVKLEKGFLPNEYQYHIVLVQSGRHDRLVEGSLVLEISGDQNGAGGSKSAGNDKSIPVKFKYYQRIDGTLTVPADGGGALLLTLTETKGRRAVLTQRVALPE